MAARLSGNLYNNKRTFPRFEFRAGVSLKVIGEEISIPSDLCISQNLSLDGIAILHSKILIPGNKVYVTIPVFNSESELVVEGSVEWVAVDDLFEDSPYWVKAGIMFSDMGNSKKNTIRKILSKRHAEVSVLSTRPANKVDFVM